MRTDIPEEYASKLPANYQVPLILLGRLARDITQKGNGLGGVLLVDALVRCLSISDNNIGVMAVIVDPINDNANRFYKSFGFIPLPDGGRMFLPLKHVKKLLSDLSIKI